MLNVLPVDGALRILSRDSETLGLGIEIGTNFPKLLRISNHGEYWVFRVMKPGGLFNGPQFLNLCCIIVIMAVI
jgi:hypothetical protein